MNELKPCPFCGGEARVNAYGFNQYSVDCKICWVETPIKSDVKNAIKAWNRRGDDGRTEIAAE